MGPAVSQYGKIGVLMGGVSSEREISLKSGKAIAEALKLSGCDVTAIDIIDRDLERIRSQISAAGIETVFIALHGALGEDGTIQALLDEMGLPYPGSGVEASRRAIDKTVAQEIFRQAGLPVPRHVIVSTGDTPSTGVLEEDVGGFPVVVKPACEGSSIGITLVEQPEKLPAALADAWAYGPSALIEKYIEGRELTVGILGERALPVVEIRPKHAFFDFEAKYTKGLTDYIVPAEIPLGTAGELQRLALSAHKALGCADFSRVDFMLDLNGRPFVLEVNTIPGFTSTSLLPKAAQERGIGFDQLCLQLMELAHAKKKENQDVSVRP